MTRYISYFYWNSYFPLYKAEGKKLFWILEQSAHLEMAIYSGSFVENLDGL